ncbi:LGFP repeat-containing protein [Crossiella sp. NPDC003009]
MLLAVGMAAPIAPPAAAAAPPAKSAPVAPVATCGVEASGPIGGKWRALHAGNGPLGCPTGAEHDVPGGRKQIFQRGEITTSVFSGIRTPIAVYHVDNEVTVDFGARMELPITRDPFAVIWTHESGQLAIESVLVNELAPHGLLSMPLTHGPGRYEFRVQCFTSCPGDPTVPAAITIPAHADGPAPAACPRPIHVGGLIGRRWREMGAEMGRMGCPIEPETAVAGRNGRRQVFERGELVWSPDQGANLVVAVASVAEQLYVEWGPTNPHGHDQFVVHIEQHGQHGWKPIKRSRPSYSGWYSVPARVGRATVSIEGCGPDPSECGPPGRTVPASTEVRDRAPISLKDISATEPAQALQHLDQRRDAVLRSTACTSLLPIEGKDIGAELGENQGTGLLAHLELARRQGRGFRCPGLIPSVLLANRMLLHSTPHLTGTTMGFPCGRDGEYDTALKSLSLVLHRYTDLMYPVTRSHLLDKLLSKYGPPDLNDRRVTCTVEEITVSVPETENHQLLIESSRYLTNQLLFAATGKAELNNNTNGLRDYLLEHLQQFVKHDFMEYNSRIYQRYSMNALFNLFDYAEDPKIRTAAQIVLDYTTTKFAVSSNMLRRAGPFRRMPDKRDSQIQGYYGSGSDPQTAFFLLWTGMSGNTGEQMPQWWAIEGTIASLTSYLPPRTAFHRVMDKSGAPSQHFFYHGDRPRLRFATEEAKPGVEIYASSPSFLVTAGGVFLNSGYGHDELLRRIGKDVGYGTPQFTTLMPTKANVEHRDLIAFEGVDSRPPVGNGRINTCVHDGFACGRRLQLPERWLACGTPARQGKWLFLDLDTRECGELGVRVALHFEEGGVMDGKYGFFHAREAAGMSFTEFRDKTLAANPNFTLARDNNLFTTADGREYQFRLYSLTEGNTEPLVTAVDGQTMADFSSYPLVRGNFMNSRGHEGYLELAYPECAATTVLDYRNRLDPVIRSDWGTCG